MTDLDAAADLADAEAAPAQHSTWATPAPLPPSRPGNGLGLALAVLLAAALSVAISLALHFGVGPESEDSPPCGGLYSECCDDSNRRSTNDDRGLFDAEANFADPSRAAICI